ncbi:MAG: HD domain-containing protein [Proteobacteria bacterium]|nr:HD domain-containing protein [Pseudomonadota bacterium]
MARAEIFSELDNRISHLSALHDIGSLLTSTLDQGLVRHMTIEALTKLMRTETGSLLLIDEETNELYFEVALGAEGEKIKRIRLGMGEGIAGWVAKHDSPVIISDVMKDDRFQSTFDHKSKFRTRNMICTPIKIHGRVIGVIQAINKMGGESFSQDDLKLFELFANQVAIALDNARLYEKLRDTFYATSEALAEAIEKRDPYTGGHTKRVLKYSLAIAQELGLDADTTETLKLSAVLHDIGKIGIADSILRKDAPLSDEEAKTMQSHPALGVEIIKHVPHLSEVIPGIAHHHERIDGHGYPEGVKEIPLVARIISVADTFDAITTTRPYRKGLPVDSALKELRENKGKQFDPPVVNACVRAHKKGKIGKNSPKTAQNRLKTP